jgi:hypothetical protein
MTDKSLPRSAMIDGEEFPILNDEEREAERACQLIRRWQAAQTPRMEIELEISTMSAREIETLNAVTAGMLAGYGGSRHCWKLWLRSG